MKRIPLSRGKAYALVDDNDYERLSRYRWYLGRDGYASTTIKIPMHKMLRPSKRPFITDHLNCNRLDNRMSNLRVVTYKQNKWNTKWHRNGRLYVGSAKLKSGRYASRLYVNKKTVNLGTFDSEHVAALMRDFWAVYLRGPDGIANFKLVSSGPL